MSENLSVHLSCPRALYTANKKKQHSMCATVYRGYQMSVGLILNLLNEFNKSVLCKPLASIILFNKFSNEPARI